MTNNKYKMKINTNNETVLYSTLREGDLLIVNGKDVFALTQKDIVSGEFFAPYVLVGLNNDTKHIESSSLDTLAKRILYLYPNADFRVIKNREYRFDGNTDSEDLKLKDIVYCRIWSSYYLVDFVEGRYCLFSINNSGDKEILGASTLEGLNDRFKESVSTYKFEKFDSNDLTLTIVPDYIF